jgi:chaperone modulatory protein CbpM
MVQDHDMDILDAATLMELDELCRACGVDSAWINEMMAHGVVEPQPGMRFSAVSIIRLRKARRLEQAFSLNTSGVALALDLLDEIERLRARLHQP